MFIRFNTGGQVNKSQQDEMTDWLAIIYRSQSQAKIRKCFPA